MQRKDLLYSLFSRMIAAHLTVTAALILLVGVAVISVVRTNLSHSTDTYLDSLAQNVLRTENAYYLGAIGDEERLASLADIPDENSSFAVLYPDNAAECFFSNDKWTALADSFSKFSDWEQVVLGFSSGNNKSAPFRDDLIFPVRTLLYVVDSNGRGIYAVAVYSDDSSSVLLTEELTLVILLILLIAVFISILVNYYSTNALIKPFRQVNEIVQQYSKGDYNVRIPISDTKEATQLALSFNAMADQLNDLEASRRSFVANVSHELRSPLTSMKGFLEAMNDGTIDESEYGKYIDIVLSETNRMTSMVNDLLDLARIESGKTALHFETFDINELIRRTLFTFEARIYERKMDVDFRFAQEHFYVEADNAKISQVLRNLIDNAIKYSPEGSVLRLAVYSLRREVFVTVQDFGQGIPQEDLPHIFDRFYKVEKAHTPVKQGGTGLGLSIVKKIIDQHGQRISVKSVSGKGTSFTFTLKRVAMPKSAKPVTSEELSDE